jgi:uncharacterized protein YutE (UPF0331/DUF86 family)
MDEILINKKTSIERCIKRIQEDFQEDFLTNYTKQDSVILNIERACQAALDMGNRMLKIKNLGLPQSNRDTFVKLEKSKIISIDLSKKMQAMAGFRNLAVHDYSSLNIEVVANIVKNNLQDIVDFSETIIKNH